MTTLRHLLVPLLLLCGFNEVLAQSNLEAKVERLEQTVRVLERRIESLEEQLRERSTRPAVASDKLNWRKLQKGMTEGEVEKLLGSPTRVDAMGAFTFWQYGERGGRVTFDGNNRTVYAWSEPR